MSIKKYRAAYALCLPLVMPATVWAQAPDAGIEEEVAGDLERYFTDPRTGTARPEIREVPLYAGGWPARRYAYHPGHFHLTAFEPHRR